MIKKKEILYHFLSIVLFLSITVYLFNPIFFEDKIVNQHDIEQWKGSSKEVKDFRDKTGDEPLWTNSMFSGMPAYLIDVKWDNNLILGIHKIVSLGIPHPINYIFISFISFYIMLLVFKVRIPLSIIGSIIFTLSSYMIIGILAGHNARIGSIAFIPLILAGVHLGLTRNIKIGFLITMTSLALQIRVNHLQITYYTLLILLIYGISFLIYSYKENNLKRDLINIGILSVAALISIGTFFGELWSIAEYSKYSIRGPSEIQTNEKGLSKDYAFQYSNGIFEPLTLVIPNILGGPSQQELNINSNLGKAFLNNNIGRLQTKEQLKNIPTYWGNQPFTAPYYASALSLFFILLGLFILNSKEKIWLIILTSLGIILSWGNNFEILNSFLFEYFPGYNKFRSVTFVIIISIFSIVLMGMISLEKLLLKPTEKNIGLFKKSVLLTGLFFILILIISNFLSYSGAVDENLKNLPNWFINNLIADRKDMLIYDTIRNLIFVLIFTGCIYLHLIGKLKSTFLMLVLIFLSIIDMNLINNRFIKQNSFMRKNKENFILTEADKKILNNNLSKERVLNLQNPFNEATTSYHHQSVGGYHGAKLRRYQDLIEFGISNEINDIIKTIQNRSNDFSKLNVINMLNVGYFKFNNTSNGVIKNNFQFGKAWYVSKLEKVKNPKEEIEKLRNQNLKNTAIVDNSKFPNLKNQYNSDGTIITESYKPYHMIYKTSNFESSFLVFSEIFYPKGWEVYVNNKPSNFVRVNYILRGLEIPAGENTIEIKFKPNSYVYGNLITKYSSLILILLIPIILLFEYNRKK
tara:strand:+ start:3084 stop:5501 length:2418 start_codon:yes stop_codon:yes gene_type:complete